MEGHASDSFLVEAESGVGLVAEVEVVPVQLAVVGPGDEVVASRMDIETGVPLDSGNQLFHHGLVRGHLLEFVG